MQSRPILKLKSVQSVATESPILQAISVVPDASNPTTAPNNGVAQKKPVYKILPKQYKETLAYLQTQYPKCFTNPPSPLAIGIHKEIFNEQQEHLSKTIIKYFLILYCSKIAYRNSLILGANRIDLHGNVTSVVTEEQVLRTIAKANHLATNSSTTL